MLLEAVEAVPQHMAGLRIQTGGWLVEDQHLRLVDQAPGDGEAPLHAPGQCLHLGVGLFGELSEVEELLDAFLDHRLFEPEVAPVHEEVLGNGEFLIQVVLLRNHAELGPQLRALGSRVEAQHGEFPCGDRADRPDHPHRAGLTCAVRTKESERLTGVDVKVDPVDGDGAVEVFGESGGGDQRSRHQRHRLQGTMPGPAALACLRWRSTTTLSTPSATHRWCGSAASIRTATSSPSSSI